MDQTKKFNWIFAIIVLGVLVYLYKLNKQINFLQSSIQNMQDGMEMLRMDNQSKYGEIEEVKSQVRELGKISTDEKTIISSYNQENKTALVDVSFKLKDYKTNDVVKVIAVSSGGTTFEAGTVIDTSNQFTTNLELPVKDNYILNVEIIGDSNRSGRLYNLFLEQQLTRRFFCAISTGQIDHNGNIGVYFTNDFVGNDKLKIKEISLSVLGVDSEPVNIDLMPYIKDNSNVQIIEYTNPEKQLVDFTIKHNLEIDATLKFTDFNGIEYEKKNKLFFNEPKQNGASYSTVNEGIKYNNNSLNDDDRFTEAPVPNNSDSYIYTCIVD